MQRAASSNDSQAVEEPHYAPPADGQPQPLGLIRLSGVIDELGVSRQWTSRLVLKDNFPAPVGLIDGKRVWCRHCVRRYNEEERPPGPRPRDEVQTPVGAK